MPNLVVLSIPFLVLLVTFLFWYQTWFGRRLTDGEMTSYLADATAPRKIQHALSQLAEQIVHGDVSVKRWYPQIVALARNKEPELRLMAAWTMGQDNKSAEFHEALRKLVADSEPMVRWNSALALARFGDPAGRDELRFMLRPFTVRAPGGGTITFRLKEQDTVRSGSILARINRENAEMIDIRSPLAGQIERREVADGARVARGDGVALVSPGEEQVWESLRALYLVGQPEDLEDVERCAREQPGMSERVRRQAAATAQAIRKRATQGKTAG